MGSCCSTDATDAPSPPPTSKGPTNKRASLSPSVTLQNLLNRPNLGDWTNSKTRNKYVKEGAHHLRNVFAKPMEAWQNNNYTVPVFPKTEEEKEQLETALKQNFVFENLKHEQIFPLVQALEMNHVKSNATLIRQGDKGDYFYILSEGTCNFVVDGQVVGQAHAGDSFGELALLYDAPRAATVIADTDCVLYRVDQQTFRYILQAQAQIAEDTKVELLKKVVFLTDLAESERTKLAAVMTPRPFHEGDVLMKKGERVESFWLIDQGTVKKSEIGKGNVRYEDTVVSAGEYMGEAALVSHVPNFFNAVALSDGMAFVIDRTTFDDVLGNFDGLVMRSLDRKRLAGIKIFQDTQLDHPTLTSLANFMVERKYKARRKICVEGSVAEAALYLIREGKVRISSEHSGGDKEEEFGEGGYFGEDQLLADVIRGKNGPYDPTTTKMRYTVDVVENCVCSVLTLAVLRKCLDTTMLGKPHASVLDSLVLRQIPMQQLRRHRILGAGTFGQVWLVSRETSAGDRKAYALKVQSKYELVEAGQARAVIHEKNIMAQLHSPFLINLVTTYKDDHFVYMLLDLVQGGEFYSIIHTSRRDKLPEDKTKFYLAGIAEGLAFMHRRGIVYRDLKPENVLIDSKGYPVIVDFGFAKVVGDKTYTLCGTPLYLAPEVILNRGHNWAADNWSLGVLLYECILGYTPFYRGGMDQSDLFKAIVRADYIIPAKVSTVCANMIAGLLTKDQTLRLGSLAGGPDDILNHAFLEPIDKEKLRRRELPAPTVPKIRNPLDASNFEDWSHLEDKTRIHFPSLPAEKEAIFEKF